MSWLKMKKKADRLLLNWKEGKLIGGNLCFYLDNCHAVIITDTKFNGIILSFTQRIKEGDKYYCKTTKRLKIIDRHEMETMTEKQFNSGLKFKLKFSIPIKFRDFKKEIGRFLKGFLNR